MSKSKIKHTKGPWVIRSGTTMITSGDVMVAYVYPQKDESEGRRNLRLIAKTPEMYDLLVKLAKSDESNDLQRREELMDELGQLLFSIDEGGTG